MEEKRGAIAIGEADRTHLRRSAKWAKFLAIVQFIGVGSMVMAASFVLLGAYILDRSTYEFSAMYGIYGTSGLYEMPGFKIWYPIVMILAAVASFFLALYLIRFASKALRAIDDGNDAIMTESFENLGKYFRLSGILTIACFALIPLVFMGAMIFAMASGI